MYIYRMLMDGKQVIGLVARAGSGKTTLANLLSERFDGVLRVSLSTPLKTFVYLTQNGKVDIDSKNPEYRALLVETADKLLCAFGTSLFVDSQMCSLLMDDVYKKFDTYVIDGIRRPDEVYRLMRWSELLGFRLRIFAISVSEDELKRRRGEDYVPPEFPSEQIADTIKAAHDLGVFCGTILVPVLELSDDELCMILDRNK